MTDPQFKGLPRHVGAFSRAGWYQVCSSVPDFVSIVELFVFLYSDEEAKYVERF